MHIEKCLLFKTPKRKQALDRFWIFKQSKYHIYINNLLLLLKRKKKKRKNRNVKNLLVEYGISIGNNLVDYPHYCLRRTLEFPKLVYGTLVVFDFLEQTDYTISLARIKGRSPIREHLPVSLYCPWAVCTLVTQGQPAKLNIYEIELPISCSNFFLSGRDEIFSNLCIWVKYIRRLALFWEYKTKTVAILT